jgi:hypothetical protein
MTSNAKWISTKDMYPPVGKEVLCISNEGMEVLFYLGDEEWSIGGHDWVEHWMLLPEPGKDCEFKVPETKGSWISANDAIPPNDELVVCAWFYDDDNRRVASKLTLSVFNHDKKVWQEAFIVPLNVAYGKVLQRYWTPLPRLY